VKVVHASQDQGAPPVGGVVERLDVRSAANEPVEHDASLEASEVGAQAVIDTRSEAQQVVRVAGHAGSAVTVSVMWFHAREFHRTGFVGTEGNSPDSNRDEVGSLNEG
jgi:hypothetical protein